MRWAWPQNMLAEVAVPGAGSQGIVKSETKAPLSQQCTFTHLCNVGRRENTHPESHLSSHRKHMSL